MLAPLNVSIIDENYLELKIQDNLLYNRRDINFTWSIISFSGKELKLKLNFSDPLQISSQEIDFLQIKILQNDLFMSIET
jgi:hypothetical protein